MATLAYYLQALKQFGLDDGESIQDVQERLPPEQLAQEVSVRVTMTLALHLPSFLQIQIFDLDDVRLCVFAGRIAHDLHTPEALEALAQEWENLGAHVHYHPPSDEAG